VPLFEHSAKRLRRASVLGKAATWGNRCRRLCRVAALPSARSRHSANSRSFTECQEFSTQQSRFSADPVKVILPSVLACSTRQRLTAVGHPDSRCTAGARAGHMSRLCEVLACWHSANVRYAECLSLPTASTRQSVGMSCATYLPSARGLALDKAHLCRVPVVWHSAKLETLGNYAFFGSALAVKSQLKP